MDDQRPQGQNDRYRDRGDRDRGDRDRGRHHRFNRHGGGGGGGRDGGGRHGGRGQRPLLTSSINAAGLSLVSLAVLYQSSKDTNFPNIQMLGWAVILFCLSALVSYVAQRVKAQFVEKISDLMFIGGVLVVIWVTLSLSAVITLM